MEKLTDTIGLKRWHLYLLVAMTGFATGTIMAKLAAALGA